MRMIQFLALTGVSAAAALLVARTIEQSRPHNRRVTDKDSAHQKPHELLPLWAFSAHYKAQEVMERANPEMQKILRTLKSLGGKPLEQLSPAEARHQPGPAQAVETILREAGRDPARLKAETGVAIQNITYPGATGPLYARLYTPAEMALASVDGARPVILYFHGGGFVIADLDAYDAAPRALAKKTGAIVVSADYRRAPEHKFPAAHNDACAAYQWVVENARHWGGDPARIALAGESAGANLAANVAMMARDRGESMPVHLLLVYPLAGVDTKTLSYQENANSMPLNKPMMEWFLNHALKSAEDRRDPRMNLIAADLTRLPPATVITADIDPLRFEGRVLAERLKMGGNTVYYRNFDGVTHEFFGMDAVLQDAVQAQDLAASQLREAFETRYSDPAHRMGDGYDRATNFH